MPRRPHDFGNGTFEFGRWETPFENADVELMEIAWGHGPGWPDEHRARWSNRTLFKSPYESVLTILVRVHESNLDEAGYPGDPLYRVTCEPVEAFRVLDEGGLSDFWHQTKVLGGRPGETTFRVRNHEWFHESVLPWIDGTEDGWSYVIATTGDCIEVVSRDPPEIRPDLS